MTKNRFLSFIAFSLLTIFGTLCIISCTDNEEDNPTPSPSPAEDQTITVDGVTFTMKAVQGGTFTMGSSDTDSEAYEDEKPAHTLSISSFWIGQTVVTQALWEAVTGSNPSYFKGATLPVEQVSWNDCQQFLEKLNAKTGKNFRLPTEAEWDYAARGGNKSQDYKYSGSNDIETVAWYISNSDSITHEVATKQPNLLGIYDMSGNVWEWCSDWYNSSYYGSSPASNPQGPATGSDRVCRGGSWKNSTKGCRIAKRGYDDSDDRFNDLGLRLALSE